jgi:hypothetical protein
MEENNKEYHYEESGFTIVNLAFSPIVENRIVLKEKEKEIGQLDYEGISSVIDFEFIDIIRRTNIKNKSFPTKIKALYKGNLFSLEGLSQITDIYLHEYGNHISVLYTRKMSLNAEEEDRKIIVVERIDRKKIKSCKKYEETINTHLIVKVGTNVKIEAYLKMHTKNLKTSITKRIKRYGKEDLLEFILFPRMKSYGLLPENAYEIIYHKKEEVKEIEKERIGIADYINVKEEWTILSHFIEENRKQYEKYKIYEEESYRINYFTEDRETKPFLDLYKISHFRKSLIKEKVPLSFFDNLRLKLLF